jgi:FtsH-binding integral membrane protein
MRVSDKLGSLSWLAWFYDHGWLAAALITAAVSWGAMNIIALVFERRVLWPSEQYAAFYWGDLIGLSGAAAAITYMARWLPAGHQWYHSVLWHGVVLWVSFVGGAIYWVMEKPNYTHAQLFSPTKLYHNWVIYGLVGYWLISAGIPVLMYSGRSLIRNQDLGAIAATLVLVGFLAFYGWTNVYDASHKKPNAHVEFDWSKLIKGGQFYND